MKQATTRSDGATLGATVGARERAGGRRRAIDEGGPRPPTNYRTNGRRRVRTNSYTSLHTFLFPMPCEFYLYVCVTLPPRRRLVRFDLHRAPCPLWLTEAPPAACAEAGEPGDARFSRPFRYSMLPCESCISCQTMSIHALMFECP